VRDAVAWLFAAKGLRSFFFGWLSVVLALRLSLRGFSTVAITLTFTATMVEDALLTSLLAVVAGRFGPRRIMLLAAPLMTVGGAVLATSPSPAILVIGAIVGTLSLNGQEAGPFLPLEQVLLAREAPATARTRVYGWYNFAGFLAAALGSLAAGAWLRAAPAFGLVDSVAYRWMLWSYAAAGLLLTAIYSRLPNEAVPAEMTPRPMAPNRLGLSRSRRVVLELSALQALDALAGGFIVQALLVYWFQQRFGVSLSILGVLFFGTNVLSAISFLAASRVAERIGLLNAMVFTHLPSNVLLVLVALMPSFRWATAMLLLRHLLSQMDVPTRQAYTMALVAPEERSAAAGFTSSARALAQSCAPALSGLAMATPWTGLPLLLAGGLKIVYDLCLYARFRSVPMATPAV
jgi:MFS family permease